MGNLPPQIHAALLQPIIQGAQVRVARHRLPEPVARVLNVLLYLALFPARGRIAKLRVEKVMADHRGEPGVDLTLLADTDTVNRRAHVVVNPTSRHTAQNPERVEMRVEQHLVGLKKIRPDNKSPAVR